MGLLDNVFNSEGGRLGLGLLAAGSARGDGAGAGQRLMEAIGSVDQWKQQQALAKRQAMQDQFMQFQMEQARAQAEAQKAMREGVGQFFSPGAAARPALPSSDSMLPEEFRTGAMPMGAQPAKPPSVDVAGLGTFLAKQGDYKGGMEMLQSLQPKREKLSAGEAVFQDGKKLYENPKEAAKPSEIQEYEYAKSQGYDKSFNDFRLENSRAKGVNVSVPINTGQKGFDNTLKLRGDFRSEPIYKAHQEVQSAYSQIQQSLKQASPAGDLAGATKIMKLLDPGSVVRESELAMAMAASGALDRLQNYAANVVNGTKLTPTQRKDFQTLADALYGESVKQYNSKRGEYQGIAERNGLSVQDVLGNESSAPKEPAARVPMKGQVVQGYKFKGGNPADQANWEKQ